jgi:hypothetical protein
MSSSARPPAAEVEPDASRRILFLDDDPARAEAFLRENPQALWVQTVTECLARLVEPWDEIHLDHDLGGKTFVDINEDDCGMEVIRWLCKAPRDHLRQARFLIHTHNSIAGLLMVLEMRSRGYRAEFRPFGLDPALLLLHDDDEPPLDSEPEADAELLSKTFSAQPSAGTLRRYFGRLQGYWRSLRGPTP